MAFVAKYPGWCHNCNERFPEGTVVRYNEAHKIRHDKGCKDPEDNHEVGTHTDTILERHLEEFGSEPAGVCPRCFMVHAGECL